LLGPHPTPKLKDHPLSAVHECLFSIFTATLHTGAHSSICNLRTHHAVVIETPLSWPLDLHTLKWFVFGKLQYISQQSNSISYVVGHELDDQALIPVKVSSHDIQSSSRGCLDSQWLLIFTLQSERGQRMTFTTHFH